MFAYNAQQRTDMGLGCDYFCHAVLQEWICLLVNGALHSALDKAVTMCSTEILWR